MWLILGWMSLGLAQDDPAGPLRRKQLPPEPRHQQDFTAYTVGKNRWRLGLGRVDYGLLDNLSVGTNMTQWVIGPNANLKVTAVQTPRFDASVQAGVGEVYDGILDFLLSEETDARLTIYPVSVRASYILSPKWSAHLGTTRTFFVGTGTLSSEQIIDLLEFVFGGEVNQAIVDALGDSVFAEARGQVGLQQVHLAAEWRFNRRDSLVFEANSYVRISGLFSGGVGSTDESGAEVSAGLGADFLVPLDDFPSTVSLSYQWSWERFNLRVGLPLTFQNVFSYFQAFEFFWLLGPQPPPTVLPESPRRMFRG